MAGETTDVQKEISEGVAATAKAIRNPTQENMTIAAKESLEAVHAVATSGWSWQKIALSVMGAVVLLFTAAGMGAVVMRTPPAPEPEAKVVTPDVKPPVKVEPDLAKMMKDGFTVQNKLLTALTGEVKRLADKPEPIPMPVSPDDKKPKPKALSLPESVTVTVGGGAVKLKALAPSDVQWHWKPVDGFSIDRYGDTLYIEATKEGSMLIVAYTVDKSKVLDFAASMVTTLKAPIPPPGPTPPPPGPTPPPQVELNELGKLFLAQALKPGRKDEAAKLAEVYEKVTNRMRLGSITTVNEAVKELFSGNTSALGSNTKYWAGFFAWADNELTRRAELGKLSTLEQNTHAFIQVGAALREASK